jgi:hypothetical protein
MVVFDSYYTSCTVQRLNVPRLQYTSMIPHGKYIRFKIMIQCLDLPHPEYTF